MNYEHDNGQEWIVCPDCDSKDAGMIHWYMDNEITLACPDCDKKEFGVEGTGESFAEEIYE